MKDMDARVEPLLSQLPQDPRLPKGAESIIRQAIVESPYLHALLGNAAGEKHIGAIRVSYGEHNGGISKQVRTACLALCTSAPPTSRSGAGTRALA